MNGRDIVASTADAAFAVGGDGRIVAWNRAAERSLGYAGNEAVGQHCWELLEGRDLFGNRYCSENCPLREMALRGEPVHRSQLHLRNALGNRVHVEISLLVVQGSTSLDKEIVHMVRGPVPVERRLTAPVHSDDGVKNSHDRLSERQLEVLALMADGLGTKQIAERLCLSAATVRHHIQQVLSRLKVHSRLEAVAIARRTGLI